MSTNLALLFFTSSLISDILYIVQPVQKNMAVFSGTLSKVNCPV